MDFLSRLALGFLRFFFFSFLVSSSPLSFKESGCQTVSARHTYALAQDPLWDGGPELQEETVRQTFSSRPELGGGGRAVGGAYCLREACPLMMERLLTRI